MLHIWTSSKGYPGNCRLDVSRESGNRAFAPSWKLLKSGLLEIDWPAFVDRYMREMRLSYRNNPGEWLALIEGRKVVLICGCQNPEFCHRIVLSKILLKAAAKHFDVKVGARYFGEIKEWDATVEDPAWTPHLVATPTLFA